jgi:hypothetical protein
MRRKPFIGAAAILAAPILAVTIVALWPERVPAPGVTPANFQRLHIGMQEKEVEAILGGPGEKVPYGHGHLTFWVDSSCQLLMGFGGSTLDRAICGEMTLKDGSKVQLRDEPASNPFMQWVKGTWRKLRGE